MVKKFSVSMSQDVLERVDERGEQRSTIIGRDLERLYTLYRRTLMRLDISIDEACLIVDVLNGFMAHPSTVKFLWAEIQDAIQLGVDKKWEVDSEKLVEKLRNMDEFQCMAIADAVERFWGDEEYRKKDVRERVKECFHIQAE